MGNTGLLRREAKMTLLQQHLGDSRRQELRNSFCGPNHNKKRGSYRKRSYGGNSSQSSTNHFPQVGENQTTEASEVVFDPIQGDKGMETPPPNDSLKTSLSPPVGGRLCSFRRDWLTNKCSDVLNIITNGYVLPFISKPNLVKSSPHSIRLQGLSKRPSSGFLYPVSSVKKAIEGV